MNTSTKTPSERRRELVPPGHRDTPLGRHWERDSVFGFSARLLCLLALVVVGCGSGSGEKSPAVEVEVLATETTQPEAMPERTRAATAMPTVGASATPEAPMAASVNGQPVYLADFERRLSQYVEALVEQGLDPGTEEGQTQLAQVESDVLESLIDYALVEQGAGLLGVTIGADEVDAQLELDISSGGGQDAFDEWLTVSGLTVDDYRQMLRESLLAQRVLDAIAVELPPRVEHAHARHIAVGTLDEAEQLLARLRDGADFADLAKQHSQDVSTRDDGGDLGWFPRGLLAPELEEAAFALEEGQVSGVIPLGEGYHIIQVVDRETSRELAPEVRMDLVLALFDGWLEEQRAAADIERYVTH